MLKTSLFLRAPPPNRVQLRPAAPAPRRSYASYLRRSRRLASSSVSSKAVTPSASCDPRRIVPLRREVSVASRADSSMSRNPGRALSVLTAQPNSLAIAVTLPRCLTIDAATVASVISIFGVIAPAIVSKAFASLSTCAVSLSMSLTRVRTFPTVLPGMRKTLRSRVVGDACRRGSIERETVAAVSRFALPGPLSECSGLLRYDTPPFHPTWGRCAQRSGQDRRGSQPETARAKDVIRASCA